MTDSSILIIVVLGILSFIGTFALGFLFGRNYQQIVELENVYNGGKK